MEWVQTDLAVANFIQAFLGPVGQQLTTLFPEFYILSEQHQEHPLQFSKLDQRLYAFEKFRERNPENAFNYFLQTHQELKDPEKLSGFAFFILNYHKRNGMHCKCSLIQKGTTAPRIALFKTYY